jgi:rhodanese-related sulfurtransferase
MGGASLTLPRKGDESLVRGIVGIVVTGALLGIAYNFWGLESNPAFGIAWIGKERVLESVETLMAATEPETEETSPSATSIADQFPESDQPLQVQIAAVKRLFDHGAALLVDAREREEYEMGHIAGAINMPFVEVTPDRVEAIDPAGRPIITYCDPDCEVSMDLAWEFVLQGGHRKVLVFVGGFPEWEAAGFEIETGSGDEGTAVAATEPEESSFTTYIDDPMGFFGAEEQEADDADGHVYLPEIPELDRPLSTELDTVKRFFDADAALLLDTREREDYLEAHIPGALLYPYDEVRDNPAILDDIDPAGRPIIAYCGGGTCEISMGVADALIAMGHRRVLVYMGGIPEWQAAGYPVVSGEEPY